MTNPDHLIAALNLAPHPEGGWYRQTWQGPQTDGRASGTGIYFLLKANERSHWHRVDADEHWLWHAGGPLTLTLSPPDGKGATSHRLGPDLRARQRPHLTVPAHHWQTAETLGAWTLVSCIVAPGFAFSGFTLAPQGWRPEV